MVTLFKKSGFKATVITLLFVVGINFLGYFAFQRFDLTHDQRYTLSETSNTITKQITSPLIIDIYLEGEFPTELIRLQDETKQLLDEFRAKNPNISYRFINPTEDPKNSEFIIQALTKEGITPLTITLQDKGKQIQEIIFPWAVATYNNTSIKIPLLKTKLGASTEENVIQSVQNLEYVFSKAFYNLTQPKQKKVAVLRGNGELPDVFIADALKTIKDSYFLAPFTLDSVATSPNKTLQQLQEFDLIIVAKPTIAFSDSEKFVLDQYVINGGKSLWLIDQVSIDMDSLYNATGSSLAYPRDLNLKDFFFKYGIRINPSMVKDVMCAPISLATGQRGNDTQYAQFPWMYAPLVYPTSNHPVITNIETVKLSFANPIDILKNDIKKTVLLQSSPYTKIVGTPAEVALTMVNERPKQEDFTSGSVPFGVLLEGTFTSVFKNRILPFKEKSFQENGKSTKMIVISDGDIIKNQLDQNFKPLELGFDKWTNLTFGNKDFILNSINYLLDENGLINIRSKKVEIPILDKEKVYEQYTTIQIITVGIPILLLIIFGFLYNWLRKRKFTR